MCDHTKTVTTVFAGIERVVCEECGHVSFSHLHDLVTDPATRLEEAKVPAGQAS